MPSPAPGPGWAMPLGRYVLGWYYFTREFPSVKDGFWNPERMALWNDFALLWPTFYQEWAAAKRQVTVWDESEGVWKPDDETGF